MARKKQSSKKTDAANEFEQMAMARVVMDEHWVVLRTLALSDQHPDLDVSTLLEMAKEQGRERTR